MSSRFFLGPDEGGFLNVLGDRVRKLAAPAMIDDAFEVLEVHGSHGSGPPLHTHPWPEAYFMLSGQMEVTVDDESRILGTGDYVAVPANAPHTYKVISEQVRFLAVAPGHSAGEFFADMDANVPFPPESMESVFAVATKHAVAFV